MYNYVSLAGFIDPDGAVDWKRLMGTEIKFEFHDKQGTLRINSYNKHRRIIEVAYLNILYEVEENDFLCGDLFAVTPLMFKYAIGDMVQTVLQQFTVEGISQGQGTSYTCRCESCGCLSSLTEAELSKKSTCNYCRGFKMLAGECDLGVTHPEVAALLMDDQLTRQVDKKSDTYMGWVCPTCQLEIYHKQVKSVVRNGLSCIYCAPSYSFGAKFVYAVLWQLDLDVCYEYQPKWAMGKRYDLYVPKDGVIVEVHGLHHYQDVFAVDSHRATAISDTFKKEIAEGQGIKNYVELDCRYSEHEWIEKQVRRSVLATKYDLDQVDFKLCLLFALGKVGERICHLWENGLPLAEIVQQVQGNRTQVRTTLMRGTYLNLCTYSAEEGLKRGRNSLKKNIVLLNTGELFAGLKETARKFKLNAVALANACKDGGYLGHDKRTGLLWQWGYEAEYACGTYVVAQKYHNEWRDVICLDTRKVFHNVQEASEAYNIRNYLHILDVCEGHRSFAGKHPNTGTRLSWLYLEDYEDGLREEQSYSGLFDDTY